MELMHFITHFFLLLFIIATCRMSLTAAKPTVSFVDSYVDTVERDADSYYLESIRDSQLRRLRRGYYYIDNGYITSVPVPALVANRRQDAAVAATPLVKYKQTHIKRKKLFVPNLFG